MYPVIGTDIFFLPGRQQVNVYLRVFATYQVFCAKKRTFARCGFCLQSELLIENEKLHAHRRLWVMMLSLFLLSGGTRAKSLFIKSRTILVLLCATTAVLPRPACAAGCRWMPLACYLAYQYIYTRYTIYCIYNYI